MSSASQNDFRLESIISDKEARVMAHIKNESESYSEVTNSQEKAQPHSALFVGSLNEKTTQACLYKYFSKFGEIGNINLISDWTTGSSKCCAIVVCKKRATCKKILSAPKHILDGKKIRVSEAEADKKGTKKISTNCLFIGNISQKTKESEVRKVFQDFGTIQEFKFFKNASTKLNTKNCIIEFTDSAAVEAAFRNKDSKAISSLGFRISPLKHKRPKTKKDQEEEEQFDYEAAELSEISPLESPHSNAHFNFVSQCVEQFSKMQTSHFLIPELDSDSSEGQPLQYSFNSQVKEGIYDEPTLSKSFSLSQADESTGMQEPFSSVITLADLLCEDDLAMAFFSSSPLAGSLRSCKPSTLKYPVTGI